MKLPSVKELIELYALEPHPEGGYFKETYRSLGRVSKESLPKAFDGERNYSTAIYYLLPQGAKSRFHRIRSDELWHFYLGGPMTLVQLSLDRKMKEVVLGQDVGKGQLLQYAVPGGCWFGACPNEETEYSFVGCTVSPGFDFRDFEMGKKAELLKEYEEARKWLEKLG